MHRAIKFFIGNKKANIKSAGIAEMNFGQLQRYKRAELNDFKIEIPIHHFVIGHKSFFETLEKEIRQELSQGIKNDIEELEEYINLDFPKIEELLLKYKFAFKDLMEVYGYDVLIDFFASTNSGDQKLQYLIVHIDSFKVSDSIEITGLSLEM
ncbi:MAG: hypothetical protein JXQ87_01940 [Bacteroidia bacterium]